MYCIKTWQYINALHIKYIHFALSCVAYHCYTKSTSSNLTIFLKCGSSNISTQQKVSVNHYNVKYANVTQLTVCAIQPSWFKQIVHFCSPAWFERPGNQHKEMWLRFHKTKLSRLPTIICKGHLRVSPVSSSCLNCDAQSKLLPRMVLLPNNIQI